MFIVRNTVKLFVLLFFLSILLSCSTGKTGLHKYKTDSHKDSYSSKNKKISVSHSYNKSKKRVVQGSSFRKKEKDFSSFRVKKKGNYGNFSFNANQRKVVSKKRFFVFNTKSKRERYSYGSQKSAKGKATSKFNKKKKRIVPYHTSLKFGKRNTTGSKSYNKKSHKTKGSYRFDPKHKMVVGKKKFLSFSHGKREGETTGFRSKSRKTSGSYSFNPKKKMVTPKKFLFVFDKKKKEKETTSFKGGKTRKFLQFNVFSKKKKKMVFRKGLFKRNYEKSTKRRKPLEMQLFNPKMRK